MNKSFIVKVFVMDNAIDILAITETRLGGDMVDQIAVNCLCPIGYYFYNLPRSKCRGGGVTVLYRKRFSLKKLSTGISFK